MIGRFVFVTSAVLALALLMPAYARAQDVPGIEICTVEKTMERRTSCLQSNVDFLMKSIAKLSGDQQQKLDAANRQIDGPEERGRFPAEDRERSAGGAQKGG